MQTSERRYACPHGEGHQSADCEVPALEHRGGLTMKIKAFKQIRKHRIFRDFEWPDDLPEFATYNVLYGWNGSGKSTLSNLLRHLEAGKPISEGIVRFLGDTGVIRGDQITPEHPRAMIRVFNKSYVDDTVFRSTAAGRLNPIYFVAAGGKEKRERIELLQQELDAPGGIRERIAQATTKEREATKERDAFGTSTASTIKELLRGAGSSYNNFERPAFLQAADRLAGKGDEAIAAATLAEDERAQLLIKKDETPRSPIDFKPPDLPDLVALTDRVSKVLNSTVVSNALESLKSDGAVESWVQQGLPLHQIGSHDHAPAGKCHFCDQVLTPQRVEALRQHFNDSYSRLTAELGSLGQAIHTATSRWSGSAKPMQEQFGKHMHEQYGRARDAVETQEKLAEDYLTALSKAIKAKESAAFEMLDVEMFVGALPCPDKSDGNEAFSAIDALVRLHNDEAERFSDVLADVRKKLAEDLVARSIAGLAAKRAAVVEQTSLIEAARREQTERQVEIDRLDKEISDSAVGAEKLTSNLAAYLGRVEITITNLGSGYQIQRGGQIAENLSEGERTAIAFLYFLETLGDRSFELENGIVVIDDPVSSLDTNSLCCAFAYMQKRTKGAGQLFVLTHNFFFFRQVKNWLHHLQGKRKEIVSQAYMIENYFAEGERSSRLTRLDPVLKSFHSEYHYLFKKVLEGSQVPTGKPLAEYYGLPNIGRRLLESFYSFRQPTSDNLRHKLNTSDVVAAPMAARILAFVHTGSHEEAGGDDFDMTLLSEAPAVMKDILLVIQQEDPSHYEVMMAQCALTDA